MRISDWSSDVCSSDLLLRRETRLHVAEYLQRGFGRGHRFPDVHRADNIIRLLGPCLRVLVFDRERHQRFEFPIFPVDLRFRGRRRSEEHTSELQSLMRISYAVFCLKKKKTTVNIYKTILSD